MTADLDLQIRCNNLKDLTAQLLQTVSKLALVWPQFIADPKPENTEKVFSLHKLYNDQVALLNRECESLNRAINARSN